MPQPRTLISWLLAALRQVLATQVTHDWGARLEEQPDQLHWCFMGCGVQHTLSPVTAGLHIALTYSIFGSPEPAASSAIDFTATPFARSLQAALDSEAFLPEGGQLRFACQLDYDHGHPTFGAADLRGPDFAVFAAGQQLGLEVQAKGIWDGIYLDNGREEYERTNVRGDRYSRERVGVILWARDVDKWRPEDAYPEKGFLGVWSSAGMISMRIPPFSQRSSS